jgi:hypothetical protein
VSIDHGEPTALYKIKLWFQIEKVSKCDDVKKRFAILSGEGE